MLTRFHSAEAAPPSTIEPVPTVFPKIDGADIAAVFAGKRVAGDFYDCVRANSERVLIGLLDVAGRREDNRNLLITAQEILRNDGVRLFSRPDINESDAMTKLCLLINRKLIEVCCGVHSCPAFIACYHEQFGTLCYTNAGHTPGLLRDRAGIGQLGSTGLPLGLFSHATCDAPTVGLEQGAALLLVSRGVIDNEGHSHRESFGLPRVQQVLQDSPVAGARGLCVSVLNSVEQFSPNAPVHDDQTALALVRTK